MVNENRDKFMAAVLREVIEGVEEIDYWNRPAGIAPGNVTAYVRASLSNADLKFLVIDKAWEVIAERIDVEDVVDETLGSVMGDVVDHEFESQQEHDLVHTNEECKHADCVDCCFFCYRRNIEEVWAEKVEADRIARMTEQAIE